MLSFANSDLIDTSVVIIYILKKNLALNGLLAFKNDS